MQQFLTNFLRIYKPNTSCYLLKDLIFLINTLGSNGLCGCFLGEEEIKIGNYVSVLFLLSCRRRRELSIQRAVYPDYYNPYGVCVRKITCNCTFTVDSNERKVLAAVHKIIKLYITKNKKTNKGCTKWESRFQ